MGYTDVVGRLHMASIDPAVVVVVVAPIVVVVGTVPGHRSCT